MKRNHERTHRQAPPAVSDLRTSVPVQTLTVPRGGNADLQTLFPPSTSRRFALSFWVNARMPVPAASRGVTCLSNRGTILPAQCEYAVVRECAIELGWQLCETKFSRQSDPLTKKPRQVQLVERGV